ncbi:hypothetical protein [Actinomadura spongiicola]|uniref:hypothetical protein n=1 Tax=Actinomadura spongiicola TaxID=2303421 RepID=UPI001314ABCD|nr:hypothetical protein [Actinomadura spongiicola]
MREFSHPESDPFAKSRKKGKRKNHDFRSANLMNNRRNARQLPARQLNRGR